MTGNMYYFAVIPVNCPVKTMYAKVLCPAA